MGTMEANVTEPPSGKTTKVIKLKAVLRAVKIAISARIWVLYSALGLIVVLFICFPFASITWFRFLRVDSKQPSSQPSHFSQLPKNYWDNAVLHILILLILGLC